MLIGGAIRLHDVVTPEHHGPRPHMAMIVHHGVDSLDPSALDADNDRNVWVIKTGDETADEIHKEVNIHLETEGDDSSQRDELMGSVGVDADDRPPSDLAAAIGALIDSARAEARQPTQEETEAAASAAADDAKSIDTETLFRGP